MKKDVQQYLIELFSILDARYSEYNINYTFKLRESGDLVLVVFLDKNNNPEFLVFELLEEEDITPQRLSEDIINGITNHLGI